jgi:hypothetical protein
MSEKAYPFVLCFRWFQNEKSLTINIQHILRNLFFFLNFADE